MYRVEHQSGSIGELKGYGITDNGYNHMPTPWKRVTKREFTIGVHFSPWTVQFIGHGQVNDPEPKEGSNPSYDGWWGATYYLMHGKAYAMLSRFGYRNLPGAPKDVPAWAVKPEPEHDEFVASSSPDEGPPMFGAIPGYWVRYYRLGCLHPHMTEKTVGNCLHRYTCPDCGLDYELDSSD